MKKLKKFLIVLGCIVLVLVVSAGLFIQSLKPDYEGKKQLQNLTQEVSVYFDAYGIPHIYAGNQEDAFRALGYVHAQDRLWQMELLRRIATGKLSEVFGEDMLKTDKFFLALGIDEATKQVVKEVNPNHPSVKLANAYLDGINQFIDNGPTPIEFHLTGLNKTHYTIQDVYNIIGYMAFSFAMAHKTDPLATYIKNKLGNEYLADLSLNVDTSTVFIKNYKTTVSDSLLVAVNNHINESLSTLPVPQFEGSNSWVIAPSKTKNGKVILANDPHIGYAQPAVWYEAHVATPNYEKYGYHLGGVPFPLLAHSRNTAYGLTMFENDDIDFYVEELHPQNAKLYKYKDDWLEFTTVTKTIKVKGKPDVEFTYKKSHHGPVLNDIAEGISGKEPIAMSWIYTKQNNKLLQALYAMSHAENLTDFSQALPLIHAPGLNVMYGDANGNVAWWATGKLYELPKEVNTKLFLDGASGNNEILRFLSFSDNPQAVNPPWDYVYSANNQVDSIAGMLYPGYYLPENRAKQIVALLEKKNDWDITSVGEMINNNESPVNPEIALNLISELSHNDLNEAQKEIVKILKQWDGTNDLNDIAPSFYHKWEYYFLKLTFHDELGDQLFAKFLQTHFHKRLIAPLAAKKESVWWDNITTKKIETKKDVVNQSFIAAFNDLASNLGANVNNWQWHKLHILEHQHPIGQVALLRPIFNVGPFSVPGTREVINNTAFIYNDNLEFSVNAGPSTRRVIDFSDVENSISILPTGQSGNPFSEHYSDQAKMYNQGKFRKMMMNKQEIQNNSRLLIFHPQN